MTGIATKAILLFAVFFLYVTGSVNAENAQKWRFAFNLRPKSESILSCQVVLMLPTGEFAWNTMSMLQTIFDVVHWERLPESEQIRLSNRFQGISILVGNNKDAENCGASLKKEIGDIFPQLRTEFRSSQVSPALIRCKNACVELDINS